MKITILLIPYDSGLEDVRMGRGLTRLIENGLPELLRSCGHNVSVEPVRAANRSEDGHNSHHRSHR